MTEQSPDPWTQPLMKAGLRPDLRDEGRRRILDPLTRWPKGLHNVLQGRRIRAVRDRVFECPASQTFHEFLVFYLGWVFGEEWRQKQDAAPEEQRHAVAQWIRAFYELCSNAAADVPPGERFAVMPTGDVQALLVLADDVYRLKLAGSLPAKVLRRLRDRAEFQSARYEIAVAAVFVRAGCTIDWVPETNARQTCEFVARFRSGEVVSVEVKSRRRDGVLHQPGRQPVEWATDIDNLYRRALAKDAQGHPLVVFLDVNRPHEPTVPLLEKQWCKDVRQMFKRRKDNGPENPARESLLVLTNWSWHLDAGGAAQSGEFILTQPDWSVQRVSDDGVLRPLWAEVNRYQMLPTDD